MDYRLQNYTVILNTHTPLHIGSGKKINKKEYFLDPRTKKAHIIDLEKMAMLIFRKNLFKSYQEYMSNSRYDLNAWIKSHNFSQREIESITAYTLDCSISVANKNREFNTFVKDAYGMPYIPGSSLKGCLRTTLLAYLISKDLENYSKQTEIIKTAPLQGSKKKILLNETNDIESTVFRTMNRSGTKPNDAVNDIMQGIIVGDSKPLSHDCLTLCQKIDRHKDGSTNILPIYNECIVPETKIYFPLSIDTSICNITAEDIKKAVKYFAKAYYENYVKDFGMEKHKYSNTLWLGGNSGYPTKTVIYNIFEKDEAVARASEILVAIGHNKNRNDKNIGISPHTINTTNFNGKPCLMGEATITIKQSE